MHQKAKHISLIAAWSANSMTKQKRALHRSATPPLQQQQQPRPVPLHHSLHPPQKKKKTSPKTLHTLILNQAAARYRAPAHLRYPPPVKAIAHGAVSHLGWTESSRPSDWKHRCQAWSVQLPEPPELRRSAAAAAAASQTEGGSADCNVSLPPSFLPPHPLLSSHSAPRVITHFLLTHTFAAVMQWDPQCRHCLDYFFFFFFRTELWFNAETL